VDNRAALPAKYILESDIKTCTPRFLKSFEPLVGLYKRFTETKQPILRARRLLSNSGVHGDKTGGNNMEDPRQSGAAFFATALLQAGGVTMYVVVAECRRQGGSVSFSFTPGLMPGAE
jgi:hypothetical protein